MVLIPKLGRDLTVTKSWRPINLINCIGKLGEKVVADHLQDADLLHHYQFGAVKGRSALGVVFRAVVKARRCMDIIFFCFFFIVKQPAFTIKYGGPPPMGRQLRTMRSCRMRSIGPTHAQGKRQSKGK